MADANPPSLNIDSGDVDEPDDDRTMADVVAPPRFPMAHASLFYKGSDGKEHINLPNLRAHLQKEGRLRREDGLQIISMAQKVYSQEPNLLRLNDPITVCGDVHGQFFDLLRLMEAGGDPKENQYLFLGDYVDRGCFSTEVVFYLFAHKVTYPKSFYMLRGNHECRHLTAFFNFRDECLYKYDEGVYDAVMNCFDNLPIAATINKKFFCVHGGLSPDIRNLKEIEDLDRFREVPREGAFCDLLWSDPVEENRDDDDDAVNEDALNWFSHNDTRQCSFVFGVEAVQTFLTKNRLTAMIRAHEVQYNGYKMHFVNQQSQIPRVITIFSAPNYCDVYKNKGACLKFDNELLNIRQFVCSPHPYYLPNFMDVFSWSLPFVAEKVTDMLWQILRHGAEIQNTKKKESNATQSVSVATENVMSKKGSVLREKVIAVTKMMNMYKTLRQEQESIIKLKQLSPNKKLPHGILAKGADAIRQAISSFNTARQTDRMNEALPNADGSPPTPQAKSPRQAVKFRDD